jgi:HK97 family phage prohead protease
MDVLGFEFKLHDLDVKSGVLRGLGAVFDNLDRQGDVIRPNAFKRTLAERNGEPIPMLWSHDTREPIGRWTEASETKEGLAVTGELLLSVSRASEVRDLMRAGIVKGLSIGYGVAPNGWKMSSDGETRELLDVDLFEISACVLAANPLARVTSPPKAAEAMKATDWEQFYRAAGFSKRDAERLTHAALQVMGIDPAEETAIANLTKWLKGRNKKGI